jgi:NADPH-dependent 2,4-dienoyl-CoA reductase/sulfur reductase-like enzyme/pSer/pThr/pTyr-binding forkhead associated (FHA) protein
MAEQISYLIIGNGIAGVTAAEILRMEDSAASIAVIADDPFPVYYRPALKDYLAGRVYEDKLWARQNSFYQDHTIHFLPERVTGIQAGQHTVQLGNGRQVAYGKLLLASGASPISLRCPGVNLEGVTTLRTVADYQEVMAYLNKVQRVVVCGSGTLALETIETLRHRGYEVTHLIRHQTLWSEVLDATASDLVLQQERRDGVDVRLQEEIAEIKGRQGQVTAVVTRNGERIPCEMVIIAIGVEPNIDFIKASGIGCGRGVRVDRLMRTNAPDIYAAGDVIETADPFTRRTRILGQWYPAIQQARAAAYSMLELLDSEHSFSFSTFYNATFLYGLDFASVGVTNLPGYQEIVADPQPRVYRKVLLQDGVPVGMLSLGDRKQALAFKRAIDHQVNLQPVAARLFDRNFSLNDWLDSQRVPPALLGVQRTGDRRVKQVAYATGNTGGQAALQTAKAAVPAEAVLIHVPDRVTGLKLPEVLLSQTKVMVVGRQPGVALLIDQGSVSRRHAEVRYANGQYILSDVGSTNGTFVNDVRIEPDKPYVLKTNDLLRFGRLVTFRFVLRALPPDTAPAKPSGSNMAGVTRLHDWNVTDKLPSSGQPVLNDDGSLQLPGAASPIPASVIASCKEIPALIVLTGKAGQRAYQVVMLKQGRHIFLGRDQNNDIMLADAEVSRRHAEVFPGPDGFYVRDLDSSNGVIINQTKITNPYLLAHGDRMTIGDSILYFIDLRSGWRSTSQVPVPGGIGQPVPVLAGMEVEMEPAVTKSLGKKPSTNTSRVKICANCGVVNTSVARFCAGCSAPLGSGTR